MTTERADRYLAAEAAARYLGVSRRTFYKHVRASVRTVHVGGRVVFDTDDLDKWAEANKTAPVVEQVVIAGEVLRPARPGVGTVREHLKQIRAQAHAKESRPTAPPLKGVAMARLKQLRAEGKIK